MSNSIQPYRSSNEIEKAKIGPEYGLIPAKEPHECSPPGCFYRFLRILVGKRLPRRSVWRCKSCSQVWSLEGTSGGSFRQWCAARPNEWTNAGGYIKPEENANE
jgi:hypothetical protein